MQKLLVGAVMAALVGATFAHRAQADTADATCEVRKDGDTQKGKSGPCTFGQRQGYIDIDLRNGDTISLSPIGNGPGKYKDQKGNKVTRTSATASGMEFKWEGGKRLTVSYVSSGGSRDYAAPGATASGLSPQRENSEWQRGFNDGLEGRYDQNSHTQPYKDGVAAGEEAARKNAGGGGGNGGGNGNYFINELDHGAFEVVWKGQNCFISYNSGGRSTSVSPGCNDKQIRRSDEIAHDRTR
jgi:hypothetical protein